MLQRFTRLGSVRPLSIFRSSDLNVQLSSALKNKPEDPDNVAFGQHFTDHMLTINHSSKKGWSAPQIVPFGDLRLHPASSGLHYGVQLFEGMKGYRSSDDRILMFRPRENMKRMARSATRIMLPEFDQEELLKCMAELLHIDQEWVPRSKKSSIYIRPLFFGTGPNLGIAPATESMIVIILCPVGPYFKTGFSPVSLIADPLNVRSWPGGTGDYKLGGNYSPTLYLQDNAEKQGFQQVLWLFNQDHEITEIGCMNFFMFLKNAQGEDELVTPPLNGMILPGVTRTSIIDLARKWNFK